MAEEQKVLDKKNDEKIAKIIMGKDYTGVIKLREYEFEIHGLSIEDQIKSIVKSKNLRKDLEQEDDNISSLTDMLATLECAVGNIYKVNSTGEKTKLQGSFLDNFKSNRNPRLFNDIVIPLFQKYVEFVSELSISLEDREIKNG